MYGRILGSSIIRCSVVSWRKSCVIRSMLSKTSDDRKFLISVVTLFGVPAWRPPVFCPFIILVFSFQLLVFSYLVLCSGIISAVFGHRALDGWRGRDSHAPCLDGIHSTPGSVGGAEGGGCQPGAPWGQSRRNRNGHPTPVALAGLKSVLPH